MGNQHGNLLYFEYVPLPISRTTVGIKADTGVQVSFLLVGDTLLDRLPVSIREKLNLPMSADTLAMFIGLSKRGIDPARARAAMMVAETLLIIWEIMKLGLSEKQQKKKHRYTIAIDKNSGSLVFKKKMITGSHILSLITKEMVKKTRISYVLVLVLWKALLGILREGETPIPSLRVKVSKRPKNIVRFK